MIITHATLMFTGPESLILMLIENGADVNVVNSHNNTALILAISEGIIEKIVELLCTGSFEYTFYIP